MADDVNSVKIFKLLMCLVYFTIRIIAMGIFGLNVGRPASPEFLSSMIIGKYDCGPWGNFLVILLSSSFQLYALTTFASLIVIWTGHALFSIFSLAELLRHQR